MQAWSRFLFFTFVLTLIGPSYGLDCHLLVKGQPNYQELRALGFSPAGASREVIAGGEAAFSQALSIGGLGLYNYTENRRNDWFLAVKAANPYSFANTTVPVARYFPLSYFQERASTYNGLRKGALRGLPNCASIQRLSLHLQWAIAKAEMVQLAAIELRKFYSPNPPRHIEGFNLGEFLIHWEHLHNPRWDFATKRRQSISRYRTLIDSLRTVGDGETVESWNDIRIALTFGEHSKLGEYCNNRPNLSDELDPQDPCGNCVARTLLLASVWNDLRLKDPPEQKFAIQGFIDHMQPVLLDNNRRSVMDLVKGKRVRFTHGTVYNPKVLLWQLLRKFVQDHGVQAGQYSQLASATFRKQKLIDQLPSDVRGLFIFGVRFFFTHDLGFGGSRPLDTEDSRSGLGATPEMGMYSWTKPPERARTPFSSVSSGMPIEARERSPDDRSRPPAPSRSTRQTARALREQSRSGNETTLFEALCKRRDSLNARERGILDASTICANPAADPTTILEILDASTYFHAHGFSDDVKFYALPPAILPSRQTGSGNDYDTKYSDVLMQKDGELLIIRGLRANQAVPEEFLSRTLHFAQMDLKDRWGAFDSMVEGLYRDTTRSPNFLAFINYLRRPPADFAIDQQTKRAIQALQSEMLLVRLVADNWLGFLDEKISQVLAASRHNESYTPTWPNDQLLAADGPQVKIYSRLMSQQVLDALEPYQKSLSSRIKNLAIQMNAWSERRMQEHVRDQILLQATIELLAAPGDYLAFYQSMYPQEPNFVLFERLGRLIPWQQALIDLFSDATLDVEVTGNPQAIRQNPPLEVLAEVDPSQVISITPIINPDEAPNTAAPVPASARSEFPRSNRYVMPDVYISFLQILPRDALRDPFLQLMLAAHWSTAVSDRVIERHSEEVLESVKLLFLHSRFFVFNPPNRTVFAPADRRLGCVDIPYSPSALCSTGEPQPLPVQRPQGAWFAQAGNPSGLTRIWRKYLANPSLVTMFTPDAGMAGYRLPLQYRQFGIFNRNFFLPTGAEREVQTTLLANRDWRQGDLRFREVYTYGRFGLGEGQFTYAHVEASYDFREPGHSVDVSQIEVARANSTTRAAFTFVDTGSILQDFVLRH